MADQDELTPQEWDDIREQSARFSPDSIWRKLLVAHDRAIKMPKDYTSGKAEPKPKSAMLPYTLMANSGRTSIDLDKEDLRIIMLALAGFELLPEERKTIREFYFYIFEELSPGLLRRDR